MIAERSFCRQAVEKGGTLRSHCLILAVLTLIVCPSAGSALPYLPGWLYEDINFPSRRFLSSAELTALDREKAKDFVFQAAKPWLQIQGKHHDPSALRLLADVITGRADAALVSGLARKWDAAYRQDVAQALDWCYRRASEAETGEARGYWHRMGQRIDDCLIGYAPSGDGVSFDDIRRWSYFERFGQITQGERIGRSKA